MINPFHLISYTTLTQKNKLFVFFLTLSFVTLSGCQTTNSQKTTRKNVISTPRQILHKAHELKNQQKWHLCTKQGQQVLNTPKNICDNDTTAKILEEIASAYYYTGNYQKCFESAKQAYDIAIRTNNHRIIISSLYLQSAAKRALKDRKSAISFIELAAKSCNEAKPHLTNDEYNVLKAKVYFNSAAIFTDLNPYQLDKAKTELLYALQLLEQNSETNTWDIRRCNRRISAIEYREKNYLQAIDRISKLLNTYKNQPKNIRDNREYMLCLEISGCAKYITGNKKSGKKEIMLAIKLAKFLSAGKDEERIKQKLKTLNLKNNPT